MNEKLVTIMYYKDFIRSNERQKSKKERHAIYERNRRKANAPDHCWYCIKFTECTMSDRRNCEHWCPDK